MIELLIIADDFTGALDTGVQFAKKGIRTLVSLKSEDVLTADKNIHVLVVDSQSRHMQPEEAYGTIYEIAAKAKKQGIKYIYKKTDSTLRGNIGSEIEAVLDAWGGHEMMFVPAFPKTGRTTLEGCQYVNGVLLHESAFSKDPLNPVNDSSIANIISERSDIAVVSIKIEDMGKSEALDAKAVYVFDCETDDELTAIGETLKQAGKLGITAGCAGFAEILPEMLELGGSALENDGLFEYWEKELLVVCGSLNEHSIRQVGCAETYGYTNIALSPAQMLTENYYDSADGRNFVEGIKGEIEKGAKLIIKTAESRQQADEFLEYATGLNISDNNVSLKIADNVGKLVKQILMACKLKSLVVFGGDTAVAVMKALECDGIMPLKEIVPGIVASKIISNNYDLMLITKAGGFGSESVLLEIEQNLNIQQ